MESFYITLKIFVIMCTTAGIVQVVLGWKKHSLPAVIFGVVLFFPAIVAVIFALMQSFTP